MMNCYLEEGSLPLFLEVLGDIMGPTEERTLLDLCCGEMIQTSSFRFKRSLHIDAVDRISRPRDRDFLLCDVMELSIKEHFDIVICSDGIEHLTRSDGKLLLENMAGWGDLSIIFTPLGEMFVDPRHTGIECHNSGWWPEEFEEWGWKTEVYPNWHRVWSEGAFFAWRMN